MNDEEKLVWILAYAAATIQGSSPAKYAIRAVEDFQQAQRHFSEDHYPPETRAEYDLPF